MLFTSFPVITPRKTPCFTDSSEDDLVMIGDNPLIPQVLL